jgi:hypothetical protein
MFDRSGAGSSMALERPIPGRMGLSSPWARTLALGATLMLLFAGAPARAQEPAPATDAPVDAGDVPPDEGPAVAGWPPDAGEPAAPGDGADVLPLPEPEPVLPPMVTTKTVAGKLAMLRTDGKAAIPRGAPRRVRGLIANANRIVGKPYKWGGGHAKLHDRGYDCSGSVSYALIKAGMLDYTIVSGSFVRWGQAGAGRWITVYATKSHVYMEVAGLRLDTSPVGDVPERGGVRWRVPIGQRRGFKMRHPVGL